MIQEHDIRDAIRAAGVDIDPNKIPIDQPFNEVGLDSMDMFNIFLELEQMFDMNIPDDQIDKLNTIQTILAYINNGQ